MVALAVITVGGIAFIAYMIGSNSSSKTIEASDKADSTNRRIVEGTVINNENIQPIPSDTQSSDSFSQWVSSQPERYQRHIRSLDNDTKNWLIGMDPEDRITYLRRAVPSNLGNEAGYDASQHTGSLT